MHKRSGAFALLAVSVPVAVLVHIGPAAAQEVQRGKSAQAKPAPPADRPCGANYTNGQQFQLATSPQPAVGAGRNGETVVRVARGAEVQLSSRLMSTAPGVGNGNANGTGMKPCPGQPVDIYAGESASKYTTVNRNRITDVTGSVYGSKRATADFRFFSRYNVNASTVGAESATTLVQVR